VTDSPGDIDLDALEAAFASPLVWWANPPSSREQLEALVQNSYCFALRLDTEMVGFARLVTDYVTFAYLTDVYVLKEHQGHGLGKFMMECIHGVLEKWPDLRRGLLITNGGSSGAEGTYRKVFGAVDIRERPAKEGIGELIAME
ncbi:Acyl-CoA N-acyltransferase, partial [Rhypophila sp. PSN 637]